MSLNSTAASQPSSIPLPALGGIAPTVSGLSAGGFMSGNMFTIYSETFVGAGIVAGNPWACRQVYDFEECKQNVSKVKPQVLQSYATKLATGGSIDSPTNMKDKKVWLFSGTLDHLVSQATMNIVDKYYVDFGADVKYVNTLKANHCFPTNNKKLLTTGHDCAHFGTPFINDCDFDGVGSMWSHILPDQDKYPMKAPVQNWEDHGELQFYQQEEFFPSIDLWKVSAAGQNGYIYTPTECKNGTQCRVHMALHGCWQGQETLGDLYITETGYLPWAASNNVIVIFPQMGKQGDGKFQECWNSWGPDDVVTNKGLQPAALKNMLDRVMAPGPMAAQTSKSKTTLTVKGNTFDKVNVINDFGKGSAGKTLLVKGNTFKSKSVINLGFTNLILII